MPSQPNERRPLTVYCPRCGAQHTSEFDYVRGARPGWRISAVAEPSFWIGEFICPHCGTLSPVEVPDV